MRGVLPLLDNTDRVAILDGGMQDAIRELGNTNFKHPLWTAMYLMKDPEIIKNAHKLYFKNGASITITSSYKTTVPLLMQYSDIWKTEEQAKDVI